MVVQEQVTETAVVQPQMDVQGPRVVAAQVAQVLAAQLQLDKEMLAVMVMLVVIMELLTVEAVLEVAVAPEAQAEMPQLV